jgi:ABC-2 type transport system ATP-binding protein
VFTTHLMEEADHLCTRLAIMRRGRLVVCGTPRDLKAAIGGSETTMDRVFIHYAGGQTESGDAYRETSQARQTARRLE